MTSILRPRIASLIILTALSACSTNPPAPAPISPAPLTRVCMGPESPDDIEDFVDVDTVRHPDASCSPPLTPDFVFVNLYGPAPAIGESLEPDHESVVAYRARLTPSRSAPPTRASQSPAPATPRPSLAPAPSRAPRANTAPAPAPRMAPAPAPRPAAPAPVRPAPPRSR